jgi:hypothetical protein
MRRIVSVKAPRIERARAFADPVGSLLDAFSKLDP